MQCMARRTETPVVFLGSVPLDARTILLDPPKQDWYKFFDFALTGALAQVEEP